MKKQLLQNKYPVFSIEIEKEKCIYESLPDILNFLKQKIEEDSIAKFVAVFDHFSHTKNIKDGVISPEIIDAQDIIFVLGRN